MHWLLGAEAEVAEELFDNAEALALGGGGFFDGLEGLAVGLGFFLQAADGAGGGVEVDNNHFAGLEVVGFEGFGAHGAGDVVPAVVVHGALGAGAAEELEDFIPRGLAGLDLCEARGQDDLAVGVDGFGAASEQKWRG